MKNIREVAIALAVLTLPAVALGAGRVEVPDARELDLAIYQSGLALVRDSRRLERPAERSRLSWSGVAETLQHETVRLAGGGLALRGWRRIDRPLDLSALLAAYVGRSVDLRDAGPHESGRLVSADPPLVTTSAGTLAVGADQLVFPQGVPAELGGTPSLELVVDPGAPPRREAVTLSYLASGLQWSLDYVGRISADGERLELVARASIENRSGMPLRDARVDLIAGAPRLPTEDGGRAQGRALRAESMARASADASAPEPDGEYYRLALAQPVTLDPGEQAAWTVFRRSATALERTYVMRGGDPISPSTGDAVGWRRVPLETTLRWTVEGGPQPGGTMRFYQARGGDGGERLLGGARPGDRSEGERVEATVGEPFDLVAERRRTGYEQAPDKESVTITRELRIRNARERAAPVRLEETVPGDWEMLSSSADWTRPAANLAVWRVEVPAGGERVIRYRTRIRR